MRRLLAAGLVAAPILAAGGVLDAEPAKPDYLPYAQFATEDTPPQIALKQAYNQAVLRYNRALYDYHVTLDQHDRLVETYNGSTDPVERQKARGQVAPLRAKLTTLHREATNRAAAVDQAARRATAAGVLLTR